MRNIERVVLWGLPPTFCAFTQRAGRAGRDMASLGEAILIVPPSLVKESATEKAAITAVEEAAINMEMLDRTPTDAELNLASEVLDEEGLRIAADSEMSVSDAPEQAPMNAPKKKKGRAKKAQETHIEELRALFEFIRTKECRRLVWNKFFENDKKMQLKYPENTLYERTIGTRCCDNCEPRLFPIETVTVEKMKRQIFSSGISRLLEGLSSRSFMTRRAEQRFSRTFTATSLTSLTDLTSLIHSSSESFPQNRRNPSIMFAGRAKTSISS